ncbi:MAG TPA: SH3 domain-containing protein [Anaerolineales bacterium]|nr:SH3 domain-containing protein [Anaerolineales bacterium]HNO85299.1 SH3 domain-containing protein [Anaerolineales bacterium]
MTFQLVYYSQQDPKWKEDILGFGDSRDTIGYVGCALTSVAMLISGHGFIETPKTLNQKLKNVNGFVSAGIRWDTVNQIYPQINVKSNISCGNTDAPLGLIDASIAAGQPVIVMVDSTPAPGLLTHWVVLYGREGNDYLMLDPWPYQTDVTKKTYLMPRYSQGNSLERAIMHVIAYECFTASGGITQPIETDQTTPTTGTTTTSTTLARVKADLTWGLNIRSSIDTSSSSNIVAVVSAGTLLTLLGADDISKIGAVNQWVRVNDGKGHEGYCAAWYLEKVQVAAPVVETESGSTSTEEAGGSTSTPPKPAPMIVTVKARVGRLGVKVYKTASAKSEIVSTEKMRAKLTVVEDAAKARAKLGVAGKWVNVKNKEGKKGYVSAELVSEV